MHTGSMTLTQAGAAAAFGYESVALASTGRPWELPTITDLCARHRVISTLVVLALVVHLELDLRASRAEAVVSMPRRRLR